MHTTTPFTSKSFYSKEKKAWNIIHFPIGTVAKAKLFDDEEFEFTVTDQVKNGPRSFVLVTDQPDPRHVSEFNSFNMTWVTSIVKRGKGKTYNHTGAEGFIRNFFEHFKFGYIPAHVLVCYKMIPYLKSDMLVDVDKLVSELYHQGVLRGKTGSYKICYNKKRLNNTIKRLINKFLVRHKTAEYEEQEAYDKMYEEDCFNDYSDPLPLKEKGVIVTVRSQEEFEKFKLENPELAQAQQETRLDMLFNPFGHWKDKENDDQLYVNTPDLESVLNKQEYLHDPVPNSKIEI